ncbi:MAG: hypothetical protein AABN95_18090 [Acidobacteriota bacterium]
MFLEMPCDVPSRLTTATNPNGTVTMTYDNRRRVSSVTDVFGQVVSYGYDANSNRTQLSLNAATSATYQYDVINRLTQLTDAASLNITFAYDVTDKLTSRTLPNGVVTTSQYDGLNRLTRLMHVKTGNTLADFQYQFSAASSITPMIDGAGTHNYSYDTRDRLTAATHPNQPYESYTLDDVGNRTASHQGSSYTYQQFNRLTAANSNTFAYYANGNLTAKTDATGSWTYTWDYENRLQQASKSSGVTVTYSYDALGRRIQRTSNAGGTTKFVYDGADVVRDLDASGGTIADYLNRPGVDNKLRQTLGGPVSYFVADRLGTTRALADSNGNVTSSLSYDSFGNQNLYVYVRNNPLLYIDPQGTNPLLVAALAIGGEAFLHDYLKNRANRFYLDDPFGRKKHCYVNCMSNRIHGFNPVWLLLQVWSRKLEVLRSACSGEPLGTMSRIQSAI